MQEREIIDGLLRRDNAVTEELFFGDGAASCRGVLMNVLRRVYGRDVPDYRSAAGAFYAHLLEDDGRRLKAYDVSRNRFYGWLRTCAVNFFVDQARKNDASVIENAPAFRIVSKKGDDEGSEHVIESARRPAARESGTTDGEARMEAEDVVRRALLAINPRQAAVLRSLCLDGVPPDELAAEMDVTTANLYNIKSRALAAFRAAVLRLTEPTTRII